MAKLFYNLDQAKEALGKNEEEIKQLTREGRLREFRDGQILMYKADQIDALKKELGGGGDLDHLELGTAESGAPIGLVDSKGGSGIALSGNSAAGLTIEDTEPGQRSGAGMVLKDESSLSQDLGLSGSVGGMPSPGKLSGTHVPSGPSALSGSQAGRSGIDVFHSDEVEQVDPSAQTAIGPGGGAMESLNTESIGSGSGLLDLTRESDDTSLGAELLDEIAPGGSGARKSPTDSASAGTVAGGTLSGGSMAGGSMAAGSMAGSISGGSMSGAVADPRGIGPGIGRQNVSTVTEVERADPMAGAFGFAALGAAAVVMFAIFALITGILETSPDLMQKVSASPLNNLPYLAGAGLAVAILFFVGGLIFSKITSK